MNVIDIGRIPYMPVNKDCGGGGVPGEEETRFSFYSVPLPEKKKRELYANGAYTLATRASTTFLIGPLLGQDLCGGSGVAMLRMWDPL